jgi:hypothetical protein
MQVAPSQFSEKPAADLSGRPVNSNLGTVVAGPTEFRAISKKKLRRILSAAAVNRIRSSNSQAMFGTT